MPENLGRMIRPRAYGLDPTVKLQDNKEYNYRTGLQFIVMFYLWKELPGGEGL